MKTTTDVLTTVTNSPDAPIIQTTVDATTTNEPTTVTDAIASTQIIVHPTISTTQDTQLTSMTSPVTESKYSDFCIIFNKILSKPVQLNSVQTVSFKFIKKKSNCPCEAKRFGSQHDNINVPVFNRGQPSNL